MKRNFKRMAQYALGAEITLSLWNRVRLWVEACDCTNSGVYRRNKFTLFAKCALIKCFIFFALSWDIEFCLNKVSC